MVAVSEQVRQQAIDLEGIQSEHISVIPNGIDLPLKTKSDKKRVCTIKAISWGHARRPNGLKCRKFK